MLCCMRRTKQVEKNDDIDQKIEQDGIKPEDKAHKAAIKIQASFRGHITRKKLKGEKKGDAPVTDVEGGEKKEVLANGLADGKTAITEIAPTENALPGDESKGENTPADEKQADGIANSGSEQPIPKATTPATPLEEKPDPAATESATKASTDNSPSLKADEAQVKEEPKQADVPATATTAVSPSAAEDATAKATAQPQTDTAVSSQNEEKTDAVEETKPSESALQEEVKEEESKADQENA
ncbi:neuromodulin [Pantherophis guttatus]|uniref:Neuromodulin n=1 Tax=Pantherophis guttatus TaxID=94885 RepID=A0A6P9BCF8_PANGU|nr:neuromodulin [Pantherophis guttatus]